MSRCTAFNVRAPTAISNPMPKQHQVSIPSRDEIIAALEAAQAPMQRAALARRLKVRGAAALEALQRRLRAMVRDAQIMETRRGQYGLVTQMELLPGRVMGHPDGYAFIRLDAGGEDVHVARREASQVLHGDRVLARISGYDNQGRPKGTIVEVLERANHEIVGRFIRESGIAYVVPDLRKLNQDVLIPKGQQGGAKSGQIVVATIEQQPDRHHRPIGRVSEVLGEHMGPGMEIDIAIRTHGLATEFSPPAVTEANTIRDRITKAQIEARRDLRSCAFVTIDGDDARDFDDAIFCRKTRGGYTLFVAIADVAHYVEYHSALDDDARERGTSVYFPDRVIPMLPERLSNGICSLNPRVDRLAIVCEMRFDTAGNRTRARFCEAVIQSRARLNYDEVAHWIAERGDLSADEPVAKQLNAAFELYQLLRVQRDERGALDIDSVEPRFYFNADRKIERIVGRTRNDAHRLIEECMIAANVAAAEYLVAPRDPFLYRVHDRPDDEKVEALRGFLAELGVSLAGGASSSAGHFAYVLRLARERVDRHLIETMVLRSLKLACYSPDNVGHFGLALDNYAHFTSPIRRYPDLVVHRAIKAKLKRRRGPHSEEDVALLGEHCSMAERRADDATRDAVAWLKCEYMEDKLGETFGGLISSVTSFGIFVELDDVFIEGLIHVTALPEDYYHFDPIGHRLMGRRTDREYRIGQKIDVTVARVSVDDRQIDFVPANQLPATRKRRRRN